MLENRVGSALDRADVVVFVEYACLPGLAAVVFCQRPPAHVLVDAEGLVQRSLR